MIISYLCTISRKQSTSSNDEEGGRVARIGNNANFSVKKYESMGAIGATGDSQNAYECGNTIGTYLTRYGFDVDFAPVADVNTNPENIVIGARAFSDDPHVAAVQQGAISEARIDQSVRRILRLKKTKQHAHQ
jgi:beta-glucosidase-like glycosyl hydrolase